MDASSLRIAVIGTGNIGSAVVTRLLSCYPSLRVGVHDINRESVRPLERLGAFFLPSAIDAIRRKCDVVITALPKPHHVVDVMEKSGLLRSMRRGTIWIDHTSTAPTEARRMGDLCKNLGVRMLEAPLTGGLELLQQGIMTALVGDDEGGDLLREMEPLLRCYTSTRLLMGVIGKASVVKILTNMLCAVHTVASGEVLAIASAAGVDKEKFFDGVRASAGNSYVFETEVPLMFNHSYDPGFTMELHCKDLRIGDEIAKKYNVITDGTVLRLSTEIYEEAMRKYGENVGSSHPARMIEDKNKLDFRVEGWDHWSYTAQPYDNDGRGRTGLAVAHRLQPAPSARL